MKGRRAGRKKKEARIAITGLGMISSLGWKPDEIWSAAKDCRTNIVQEGFRTADGKKREFYFHKVRGFEPTKFKFDNEVWGILDSWKNGRVDEDLLWAIAAGQLALRDGGLEYDREHNEVALFVTHENPGLELFFDQTLHTSYDLLTKSNGKNGKQKLSVFMERMYEKCIADGYDAQTFMYLYLIAKALGVHGFTSYNCNACASGLYALEMASREILCGDGDAAIVIASDHPRYIYKFLWFGERGLYAADGLIKPFDANRDGFTIGDGAAALLIEPWERAKARGAHIYAEYLGGGFGAQGWKVTAPDLTSRVYGDTMIRALKNAGLCADEIDLIVPHGVGTGAGDAYEAQAINRVFGGVSRQPPITALKPYIGHNLGGSSLLETVLTILSMRRNAVLPVLNYQKPDPVLNLHVATQLTTRVLQHVMKTASGFAGYDASIVLRTEPS